MYLLLLWACGVDEPADEPVCEEAVPNSAFANGQECRPFWVCCAGDPSDTEVGTLLDPALGAQCWYQSGDPASGERGLVWECGASLTNCESAPVDASEWACGT